MKTFACIQKRKIEYLVKMSAQGKVVLYVQEAKHAELIKSTAKRLGLKIPEPRIIEDCACRSQISRIWFDEFQKPPLGLKPKNIHDEERMSDIAQAISRYIEAVKTIPTEWVEEYNELSQKI